MDKDAVVRNFRTTATDGKNYQVLHYNLDVIIALGYRVQSPMMNRQVVKNKFHKEQQNEESNF